MPEPRHSAAALATSGLAAVLASACCLGPLVLVATGFSGAWIGSLGALEGYRPVFIGTALVALIVAAHGIFRPASACKPGEVCATPRGRAVQRAIFWIVAAFVTAAIAFPYVQPLLY